MKISVRSIPKTFHRAKMAFTEKPQVIEVDKKTYDVLRAEPLLVVEVLPEKESDEEQSKAAKVKAAKVEK